MLYISTSCVKAQTLTEAIKILHENGFSNIELSGGAGYHADAEREIIDIRKRFGLDYLCHNYFVRSEEPFTVNLASLDDRIYEKSLEYLKNAVMISDTLEARKFGIHAGFFVDISAERFGKRLPFSKPSDRGAAINRFCEGFNILKSMNAATELYVENNVYSLANRRTFGDCGPFMLLCHDDYVELKEKLDFKLLLDIAHLKVSCNSLGLDFDDEAEKLIKAADYMHLSETSAPQDQNRYFSKDSPFIKNLKPHGLGGKTITLEVYEDMDRVKESYDALCGIGL